VLRKKLLFTSHTWGGNGPLKKFSPEELGVVAAGRQKQAS